MRSCALRKSCARGSDRRQPGAGAPLRRLTPVLVMAAMLTGCARGDGIDLAAMMADHNCEQGGYQLGTPPYADCRTELARRADAAAMQAYYRRQQIGSLQFRYVQ
jgi:hypothetical protein